MGVHAHKFSLLLHVGDHIVDGHLSRSAGGGGHSDDGHAGVLGGGGSLQAPHIGELRVGDDDAHGLGRIHGGTSPDGHDVVRAGRLERRHARLHVLDGGVGFDVRIYLVGQSGVVQRRQHLAGDAETDQIRVGTDKCLAESSGLGLACDLLDRTGSVVGSFIQYNAVAHDLTSPFLRGALPRRLPCSDKILTLPGTKKQVTLPVRCHKCDRPLKVSLSSWMGRRSAGREHRPHFPSAEAPGSGYSYPGAQGVPAVRPTPAAPCSSPSAAESARPRSPWR